VTTKPLRISWSAIRTHEECKERSFLVREGKRAKVTNIRNFYPGLVVDQFMREYLETPENPALEDPAGWISSIMDESEEAERGKGNMVKYRDRADRNEVQGFCTELALRLIPILDKHVLPYTFTCGHWFKIPMTIPDQQGQLRDVLLTGEMDLLVENDGPVVWDLKGTADAQYWRKVIAQLTFYDVATWVSTGIKTRFVGLIQPMCPERILAFEVTDAARRDLMIRIQHYAHDVWAGERTCTDNAATCHWCDVRHACSRYQQPSLDVFGNLAAGLRTAAGEAA
jgi:PD-(D/E)XK nuclease superfamily protein